MGAKGQNKTKMALRVETRWVIKGWKCERWKKEVRKGGTGKLIRVQKPEMEERIFKRQKRTVKEIKNKDTCIEKSTLIRLILIHSRHDNGERKLLLTELTYARSLVRSKVTQPSMTSSLVDAPKRLKRLISKQTYHDLKTSYVNSKRLLSSLTYKVKPLYKGIQVIRICFLL
jgi:hypothetical protein